MIIAKRVSIVSMAIRAHLFALQEATVPLDPKSQRTAQSLATLLIKEERITQPASPAKVVIFAAKKVLQTCSFSVTLTSAH